MRTVDQKLKEMILQNDTYAAKVKQTTEYMPSTLQKLIEAAEVRTIVQETRNEQLVQEKKQKSVLVTLLYTE